MEQLKKCDFSEEVFISRVAHYPELYNLAHPDFKSISKRQKSWTEIAASFNGNIDGDSLSKRWRLLRDSYLRCKRGIVNGRMKRGEKRRKMWKHFSSMTFIDDIDCANDAANNEIFKAHNDPLTCARTDNLIELDPSTETSMEYGHSTQVKEEPGIFLTEMHPTEALRSASRDSLDSSQEITTTKLTTCMRTAEGREESFNASILKSLGELEDEDTLFVKCLIPYFKKLPMEKKLELKIKFMELLLDATRCQTTTTVICDLCKMAVTSTEAVSRTADINSIP